MMKWQSLTLALLTAMVVCSHCHSSPLPTLLGSFAARDAAFINSVRFEGPANTALLISSFSVSLFRPDTVFIVPNVASYIPDHVNDIEVMLLTQNVTWPNEQGVVPQSTFQADDTEYAWIAGGFLPPTKTAGAIGLSVVDSINGTQAPFDTGNMLHLSTVRENHFYHICNWHDMDNDGLEDCMTARTIIDGNEFKGELLFLQQPPVSPLASVPWKEVLLASGPDVLVHFTSLRGASGQPAIVAAQFFSEQLRLYWTDNVSWSVNGVQSRLIDGKMGAPFDALEADLNIDGQMDLLVTNHQHAANESAVFAYVIPEDWRSAEWERHVLSSDIPTLKVGPNQASPGQAIAFHPAVNDTSTKPFIALSGDGSEYAYILTADSEDPDDWSYTRNDLLFAACTVGQISVEDVNDDGWVEVFVPAYENGTVWVYSYAPA